MLSWLSAIFGLKIKNRDSPKTPNSQASADPQMNQGDFHSGPNGYSPNTAYPETQYGSGFDEDAEWNEGDWR